MLLKILDSSRITQFVRSAVHPTHVRTNQDTDLIRLIACLSMLIDHTGKMFFPQLIIMRIIGRLAFPMFAYCLAVGAVYTRNPLRYISRIATLAIISQPLYALALDHSTTSMFAIPFFKNPLGAIRAFYIGSWHKPSILLSLLLGLCILLALRYRHWTLALMVYIICCRFGDYLDYGIGGIRLMILFYGLCAHPKLALPILCTYMIAWSAGKGYTFMGQTFGMRIFALPSVFFCCTPMKCHLRLSRWLTYGFYPAHLLIIAIVCRI